MSTKLVKYPRTYHLPWSESNSSDDVWWKNTNNFKGKEVVVTHKLDGESTTMYQDHIHARSMDSKHHPSRNWVKQLWGAIKHEIPQDYRICGENLYAFHSIFYTDLPSYFFCYGIYDENNVCLSWDDTVELCKMLNLETVPVFYKGIWDEKIIKELWNGCCPFPTFGTTSEPPQWPETFKPTISEGYVVRTTDSFPYDEFKTHCAKMVRKNHVTTTSNWMMQKVLPNLLKDV